MIIAYDSYDVATGIFPIELFEKLNKIRAFMCFTDTSI